MLCCGTVYVKETYFFTVTFVLLIGRICMPFLVQIRICVFILMQILIRLLL